MPSYPTPADVPESYGRQTWQSLVSRIQAAPDMAWLKVARRHDIPALRLEDSPTLCIVKIWEDWEQAGLNQHQPPYNVTYGYGVRLYVYCPMGAGTTVEDIEAAYDQIEDLNEILMRVLVSKYMACNMPYWKQLFILGGKNGGKTSVIGRDKERLFITTRIAALRHFRPGSLPIG